MSYIATKLSEQGIHTVADFLRVARRNGRDPIELLAEACDGSLKQLDLR